MHLKSYVKYIKSFGRCSIYEILKNDKLKFFEKVAYIRHTYAYYDGNYDYYFSNGKANENRKTLNTLIENIVSGKAAPEELTRFNKKVKEWKKENKL